MIFRWKDYLLTYLVGRCDCLCTAYLLTAWKLNKSRLKILIAWNLSEGFAGRNKKVREERKRKNKGSREFGHWCTCSRVGGEGGDI